MKLNIGVITEIIDLHSGSRAPLEIAINLAKLKHKVTIYAHSHMEDKNAKRALEKHGIKVITINRPHFPIIGKYIAAAKLFRILKKQKHQIMTYSGMLPFFLAGTLSGIPIVRIYQGTQFNAYLEKKIPDEKPTNAEKLINYIANVYIYLVERLTTSLSAGVVTISQVSKKEAEKLYGKKVNQVIYHGTTILKSPKKENIKKGLIFLTVSRITPYKGFHKIINALGKVKTKNKFTYLIVGSQPKKNYLKYLKKIGGKNIKIVENPKDYELAHLYKSSSLYLNADQYLYFGLPIMEAAYYKIPTVSFDFAAASELVDNNKTGYVAKNEKEFVDCVEKLIKNKNLREKMGQNAYFKATNKFTWKKAARDYVKVFQTILDERKNS